MGSVQLIPVPGLPLVETGDDLAQLILDGLAQASLRLEAGDVLAITSKIVSKSEGRWVDLATVIPDEEALRVADACQKDPREVAVILGESRAVSRTRPGLLITEHRLGFICANAGIDHSNTRPDGEWRLLLPEDPNGSARQLRARITKETGVAPAIIITDSHGRAFRMGTVGVAIGSVGLPALWDLRGRPDMFGTALQVTEVGFADELAAASGLVMGQTDERVPVVIIRGLSYPDSDSDASDLVRPRDMDLYR